MCAPEIPYSGLRDRTGYQLQVVLGNKWTAKLLHQTGKSRKA